MVLTPSSVRVDHERMPDSEVLERPVRRRFNAEYKLRIVEEANAASEPGAIGALLRREGLYSSHLVDWPRLYRSGALGALAQPRGQPRPNPLAKENERLRRRRVRRLGDIGTPCDRSTGSGSRPRRGSPRCAGAPTDARGS